MFAIRRSRLLKQNVFTSYRKFKKVCDKEKQYLNSCNLKSLKVGQTVEIGVGPNSYV